MLIDSGPLRLVLLLIVRCRRSKSSVNDVGAEARMARCIEGRNDSNKMATISSSGASDRRRSASKYFCWRKMAVFSCSLCFLEYKVVCNFIKVVVPAYFFTNASLNFAQGREMVLYNSNHFAAESNKAFPARRVHWLGSVAVCSKCSSHSWRKL